MKENKIITDKEWQQEMSKKVEQGYITAEGQPLKCIRCGSENLDIGNIDYIDNIIRIRKYCYKFGVDNDPS